MTGQTSTVARADRRHQRAVERVERDLRDVALSLRSEPSAMAVRAAQLVIDSAERTLGALVQDPWEPSVRPVREAREILSSHLLAASACEGAEVAPPVTARVLQRGADSARTVLAGQGYRPGGVDPAL